jgi:NAD(P)-dependent dehydrogenase (short-subunit alcohol dehydrogenase family)
VVLGASKEGGTGWAIAQQLAGEGLRVTVAAVACGGGPLDAIPPVTAIPN